MTPELQKKWDEAERTGRPIEVGEFVVCDYCSADYTTRQDTGGIIFGSKGICPACAPRALSDIRNYHEEHYIKARCPDGMSFADFIRDHRGPGAAISVTTF